MINPALSRLRRSSFSDGYLAWTIRALFAISVFLIVILSVSYHTINQELLYYSDRVDHTHEVLDEIQRIRVAMYETTYYGRGFLLLGDDASRAAMLARAVTLPYLTDTLSRLIADNKHQIARAEVLRDTLAIYGERILRFASSNPLSYSMRQKTSIIESGGRLTANINQQLDELQAEEETLKVRRTENRDSYKQQVLRFNWVIMGVALVLLLSSFLLLERELGTNRLYKQELESKVDNLNRSNSELEQFAYVASHDLQEPLRKIRSFLDFINTRNDNGLGGETLGMLKKIDRSATRMQMLIDDLLSFSRSLQVTNEPEVVDLNDILREVKSTVAESLSAASGTIRARELPKVQGHESQLNQLFQNLISNAIKYRKTTEKLVIDISCEEVPGSAVPEVRMAQKDETFHMLTFKDNGIGFGQEYSKKIFVIFQRLHGIDAYEGSGIGLAICRKIIFNHRGYIIAEGEEGRGAKFCVYLPKKSP